MKECTTGFELRHDGFPRMTLAHQFDGLDTAFKQLKRQPSGLDGFSEMLISLDVGNELCQFAFNIVAVVYGPMARCFRQEISNLGFRSIQHLQQRCLKRVHAFFPIADGGNHGTTQQCFQCGDVQLDAAPLRVVHHVEHEQHGLAELQ